MKDQHGLPTLDIRKWLPAEPFKEHLEQIWAGYDEFFADPISERSRRFGRWLLAVALVGIAMTWGGVVPESISFLGADFSGVEQERLLQLLAMVVAYSLLLFVGHAVPDWLAWKAHSDKGLATLEGHTVAALTKMLVHAAGNPELSSEQQDLIRETKAHMVRRGRRLKIVTWSRAVLEVAVPPLAAAVALVLLLSWKPPADGRILPPQPSSTSAAPEPAATPGSGSPSTVPPGP
jgi:hypothetical protein